MMSDVMKQWLEVAPQWVLDSPEWWSDFVYKLYKCFIFEERYMLLVKGLGNTLLLTFFALILGVILGVVIALVRVTWDNNHSKMVGLPKFVLRIANMIAQTYLTVIRGTPVVVQIMIMFFVILPSVRNKVFIGCLAFGINSGAYVAEIIRGGIMSVDSGQMEAGRSIGFGYVPTMSYVILPQAFKNILPALGNEFIVLLKETAVVGYIGLADMTYAGNTIGGNTYEYLYPLGAIALVYLVLVVGISSLIGRLERRLRNSER